MGNAVRKHEDLLLLQAVGFKRSALYPLPPADGTHPQLSGTYRYFRPLRHPQHSLPIPQTAIVSLDSFNTAHLGRHPFQLRRPIPPPSPAVEPVTDMTFAHNVPITTHEMLAILNPLLKNRGGAYRHDNRLLISQPGCLSRGSPARYRVSS